MKKFVFFEIAHKDKDTFQLRRNVLRPNELHLINQICKDAFENRIIGITRTEIEAENLDMAFNKVM